jgi:hypothetical protein
MRATCVALLQGPSLRFGLCCPNPSSLNRPHPPHSRAPRDFAALRLIRGAFAVRERLGDPRVVPVFRCTLLPDMPPPKTPGSSNIHKFQSRDVDIGLRRCANGSALPITPANPFRAGGEFRGFHGSHICYGLSGCSAPCTDLTGFPAIGAFYFQASNRLVALPVAGYNYSIDWTPMLAGLSPAGMAASLAAPDPYVPISSIRFFTGELRSQRCIDGRSGLLATDAALGGRGSDPK